MRSSAVQDLFEEYNKHAMDHAITPYNVVVLCKMWKLMLHDIIRIHSSCPPPLIRLKCLPQYIPPINGGAASEANLTLWVYTPPNA
jgi:hypothetical protein